jgi:hypothetical protein
MTVPISGMITVIGARQGCRRKRRLPADSQHHVHHIRSLSNGPVFNPVTSITTKHQPAKRSSPVSGDFTNSVSSFAVALLRHEGGNNAEPYGCSGVPSNTSSRVDNQAGSNSDRRGMCE